MLPKLCTIPECDKKMIARGWCTLHWQRWKRHGDPVALAPKVPFNTRFFSKINKSGPTPTAAAHLGPCWVWTDAPDDMGYGRIAFDGNMLRAHRVAWTVFVGEIQPGMELDHRCRRRICVNPAHLRVVTKKQNLEHLDVQSNNKSGYRGVSFHAQHKKWMVSVRHNGATLHGGYFEDVQAAGAAAQVMRNELFTHNDLDRSAE